MLTARVSRADKWSCILPRFSASSRCLAPPPLAVGSVHLVARDDFHGKFPFLPHLPKLFDVPLDGHRVFEGEIGRRIGFETVDRCVDPGDFKESLDDIGIGEDDIIAPLDFAAVQYRIVDFGL
ncbi:hypothetical protein EDD52_11681 [Primorskyibacter sedentarius]|uniref:Uncharacterized protein n=1 Tax=Primorskyibacter sedentarius TaxID=745311 RepID=A0A4R3J6J4_9RHOB|nr:hypothetical protein EDD52_11681 [Primorskyibacter sedentarius]